MRQGRADHRQRRLHVHRPHAIELGVSLVFDSHPDDHAGIVYQPVDASEAGRRGVDPLPVRRLVLGVVARRKNALRDPAAGHRVERGRVAGAQAQRVAGSIQASVMARPMTRFAPETMMTHPSGASIC